MGKKYFAQKNFADVGDLEQLIGLAEKRHFVFRSVSCHDAHSLPSFLRPLRTIPESINLVGVDLILF